MKILKTILYILLAVVLVLVLLGLVGPKDYDVSRTVQIDAPPATTFDYVKSIKNQSEWGPWNKLDPDINPNYEGEDGTVGFVSSWDSDKVGKGKQEIKSISGNTMETEMTFYMPWGASKSTGYYHVAEAQNGSEVTWGIRGENDFVSRIFGVFSSMDKSIGPMFEEGLDSLKVIVERKSDKKYDGYEVTVQDMAAKQYVAARGTVQMDEISAFLGQHFGRIAGALGEQKAQMTGPPSGLYYTWDPEKGTTDMAAGIPVGSAVQIPETQMIEIPAGKAAVIEHYGSYLTLEAAHNAADAYLKDTGMQMKFPVIEEYITDPETEPDSTKWLTKIYYLLDQ